MTYESDIEHLEGWYQDQLKKARKTYRESRIILHLRYRQLTYTNRRADIEATMTALNLRLNTAASFVDNWWRERPADSMHAPDIGLRRDADGELIEAES